MNIQNLPPLPAAPNGGKSKFSVDLTFAAPELVKTRLGSIPADYSTSSGREKVQDIYFAGEPEAANPRGHSTAIWRNQPMLAADGQPKMQQITETITAKPASKLWKGLGYGTLGAVVGGGIGALIGHLAGNVDLGLKTGAALGGSALGALGVAHAAGDRVRLEWQNTPIVENKLTGYRYEIDEDETRDSDGNVTSSEYDHEFRPLIASTPVGSYARPVVVHYREK